jgi:hypothetical protein
MEKEHSKVWCPDVIVKTSTFSTDTNKFDGAFARRDFKKGELIEKGIMRRLPPSFDGNSNPHVFTWSNERPNKVWGMPSGCAFFYNTNNEENSNTLFQRFFDEDKFEVYAKRDIKKGEELTHTYLSLQWRDAFVDINKKLNEKK